MAETPDSESKQGNWEREVGLKEETTYVAIYPARTHAETWMQEAKENDQARSRYLIELIQEARAKRQGRLSASDTHEKRVEELTRTIERLEDEIEATHESSSSPQSHDALDLKPHLTNRCQPMDNIVDTVLDSNELPDVVTRLVEDQLYQLAEQDEAEYKHGFGWRLTDDEEAK